MKGSRGSDSAWLLYLVFKAGDTEMQQIQQAVDLQHRQIGHPALQESSVCVFQHPQETHQQSPAALCRQRAALAPGLTGTYIQTQCQSFSLLQYYTKWLFTEGYRENDGQGAIYRQVVVPQKRATTWEECKCYLNERLCEVT